ncbi:putative aspartyl protease [Brevundimonas bullata]|uniref:Putative aspartyl protease n=1 Tax=Brevundimonas bullata TaxID=13160 RepID=A0A7W7IRL2_9CAUL|nr:pepsin/retropepsin-like aspartic protease family protein [Brevundimonas bullata]MBB4799003.1 putative aspartyl protease [Brevundimonas bullata]MBB6383963.1 putative aspartyl protease [Brevundimonas bullata]
MRRRSFMIRVGAAAAAVGGGLWLKDHVIWRRPTLRFPDGGTSGWSPFVVADAATPTVRVRIAGREVTALIDSGAQYSVIDRALVEALGLTTFFDMPLVAYGVGGQPQVGRGVTLDMAVGTLTVSGLRAAILDLGPLADAAGLGTPLVLGQDLLGEAVLDLDMKRRRARFADPDGHVVSPAMRAVPVKRSGTALTAEVTVEGAVMRAVIDTGFSSLIALSQGAADAAGLLDGRPETAGASIVLGGMAKARVIKARTVTFGDDLWRGVETPVFADSPLPNYPDALLGVAAFEDREVVVALGRGQLHVSPMMDLTVG